VKLVIEMSPGFHKTVSELDSMGQAVVAARSKGMEEGGRLAAVNVTENYLSGQYLKRRTSRLAGALGSWMAGELHAVVGVPERSGVDAYKYLLGDEAKTITPKKAKFLTIPIGEALTASGVSRFSSPRQVPEGFFVRTGGRLLYGYKKGKRGRFRPLFVLVKSVTVQGTGALADGVAESIPDIANQMQSRVDEVTGR
jgi:hypothetical protein